VGRERLSSQELSVGDIYNSCVGLEEQIGKEGHVNLNSDVVRTQLFIV
jgi:hypothetical protein